MAARRRRFSIMDSQPRRRIRRRSVLGLLCLSLLSPSASGFVSSFHGHRGALPRAQLSSQLHQLHHPAISVPVDSGSKWNLEIERFPMLFGKWVTGNNTIYKIVLELPGSHALAAYFISYRHLPGSRRRRFRPSYGHREEFSSCTFLDQPHRRRRGSSSGVVHGLLQTRSDGYHEAHLQRTTLCPGGYTFKSHGCDASCPISVVTRHFTLRKRDSCFLETSTFTRGIYTLDS